MEYRVLHIDPDPGATRHLSELLGSCAPDHFEVDRAASMGEARRLLASSAFDVVVAELGLPDGGGVEQLREGLGGPPRVPLVVWSNVESPGADLAALRAGAQDFLHKREDRADLCRAVRFAVERHRVVGEVARQLRDDEVRAAQQAAERAHELLECVFANTHLKIAYLDPQMHILRVNRAYAEADGRTPEFFVGKGHFDLYPHPENQAIFERVVRTGQPYHAFAKPFDYADDRHPGTTYWDWTLQPVAGEHGGVDGLILSLVDVTERVMAEEAATVERRRLFEMMEGIPASVHLVAADKSVPFANRYFVETLGPIVDRPCHEVLYGEQSCCRDCYCQKVIESGVPAFVERRRADGRVYESKVSLFTDSDGTRLALEMAIDVTARREAEEARRAAEGVLEEQRAQAVFAERLRSLGQMAAGIAHELNQPLLGVRGLAEHMSLAVERGWALPPNEILEKTNLIVEQADRMSHVIEHARMFVGGIRSGRVEPVDLNEVVRSAHGAVVAQLMDRNMRMELALAPSLPLIQANQYSLEQVLINLLANARDAYDECSGGRAHVVIVRTAVARSEGASHVGVRVIDRGKGIPEHLRSKVFEPFFTTKGPDGGTGLGLSIARSLVETYGGSIHLQSNEGVGTEVTITFPVPEP